ncbi:peptidase M15 [Flavobacterium covae]|uniref:D-alanyl-D-alanine dipeptidase n=2 Tax=Flavobacterium TaxID=237 RepID=A0AA94EYS2_9FLAO|nr:MULTISPECIES: M15 family metallopeptidase [Flavobacterium]OXA83912.1 peptidase M15 [Flavobacterium columnare] [Flavobacterium columnare NBRC 100251 = ATCC 23463]AMA49213.1 peptidase M15 [Flavobacterium covae]MCH4828939.1 M15 family metallopeptidase [Flavobacterium columnare]MCH4831701.1 M15 family metallopeptidase [Flavobacterium columnare]MCJ1810515.1 M15 family metallopeptidase [Flavobacterium covae]
MFIKKIIILITIFFSMGFFSQNKNVVVVHDTTFVNIKDYSKDFILDIRYATNDNFLKSKVYDCDACYLRYKTVKQLIKANKEFLKEGYRIKLFDCYRPLSIQKKMWKIISNPNYVANPEKGSIHNRGGAVDLTLVDKLGNELNMGTEFDHFGKESSHTYSNLSKEILKNRKWLKDMMKKHHFDALESEWWHYGLEGARYFQLSNFNWKCN